MYILALETESKIIKKNYGRYRENLKGTKKEGNKGHYFRHLGASSVRRRWSSKDLDEVRQHVKIEPESTFEQCKDPQLEIKPIYSRTASVAKQNGKGKKR